MSWRDAFSILLPPQNPTPETLEAWRLVIFASIVVLAITLATHILLSRGRISPGHGFVTVESIAYRDEQIDGKFMEITTRLDRTEVRQVQAQLRDLRAQQCEAIRDENREAVRSTTRLLDQYRAEYHLLTDREYPLPTCIETGVRVE